MNSSSVQCAMPHIFKRHSVSMFQIRQKRICGNSYHICDVTLFRNIIILNLCRVSLVFDVQIVLSKYKTFKTKEHLQATANKVQIMFAVFAEELINDVN